jgi:hypothetical protein
MMAAQISYPVSTRRRCGVVVKYILCYFLSAIDRFRRVSGAQKRGRVYPLSSVRTKFETRVPSFERERAPTPRHAS